MAKVITQETYDEIIKENILEFAMSVEEAREETIKQLEAQVKVLALTICFFLESCFLSGHQPREHHKRFSNQ